MIILTACSTPKVVEIESMNDDKLTCSELDEEINAANDVKINALDKKGLTLKNTTAFLFWLPGLVATYLNVDDAVEAADSRINHLEKIKTLNNC